MELSNERRRRIQPTKGENLIQHLEFVETQNKMIFDYLLQNLPSREEFGITSTNRITDNNSGEKISEPGAILQCPWNELYGSECRHVYHSKNEQLNNIQDGITRLENWMRDSNQGNIDDAKSILSEIRDTQKDLKKLLENQSSSSQIVPYQEEESGFKYLDFPFDFPYRREDLKK